MPRRNAVADGAIVIYGKAWSARNGAIDGPLATAALAQLGIDHLGLDGSTAATWLSLRERPVGIEAICAELW